MPAAITGCAKALPARIVDNIEMSRLSGVDPAWIEQRSGIKARHIASTETTLSLALEAGAGALADAGCDASELDFVIVATVTADRAIPAVAPEVQSGLGASAAAAFDVNAGCSGFLYALAQATALIEANMAGRVLVCGSDVLSRVADPADPRSYVLLADGAGAVVVEWSESPRIGPFVLRSDGSAAGLLEIPPGHDKLRMEGRAVYRHAVDKMASAVQDVLRVAGGSLDDVDLVVAHQANARILDAIAQRVALPAEKMYSNIATTGNTSAGSIPIALADAVAAGRLRVDDRVVLAALGAGLVWGAGMVTWGRPAVVPERERTEVAVGV